MPEFLRRLYAYDHWANRRVFSILEADSLPSAEKLLAHIVATERIWLARLRSEPAPSVALWPAYRATEVNDHIDRLSRSWSEYFDGVGGDGLSATIRSTTAEGELYETSAIDIVTHVAMHSAYHRGQIANLVRSAGHDPAVTDFMAFALGID